MFGVGDLTLLGLVARVGTGTGFTIAQLSLLVNASIGIWAFHVPKPGTPQARKVLAGILIAGAAAASSARCDSRDPLSSARGRRSPSGRDAAQATHA